VFVNTGNEYPDIIKFVRTFDNVRIIRPKMKLKQVIEKYGFPLISKECSKMIYELRKGTKHSSRYLTEITSTGKKTTFILPVKYRYLIDERFGCSHKCCDFLKKLPTSRLNSITGEMTSESIIRQSAWLNKGCNTFGKQGKHSKSKPLSIWTEADIQAFIRRFDIRICSLYADERIQRTGCMFCGFGAHLEAFSRFEVVREKYPKLYDYFLAIENNGVTYKEALNRCGIRLPGQPGYQTNIFAKEVERL
jgi:hypothetical protein